MEHKLCAESPGAKDKTEKDQREGNREADKNGEQHDRDHEHADHLRGKATGTLQADIKKGQIRHDRRKKHIQENNRQNQPIGRQQADNPGSCLRGQAMDCARQLGHALQNQKHNADRHRRAHWRQRRHQG